MVDLREPLDQLAKPPVTWTKGQAFRPAAQIRIYDDTLRDGEQMPAVAFSPEQQLELAILLSALGGPGMDVACPVVSDSGRRSGQLSVEAERQGRLRPDVETRAPRCSTRAASDAAGRTGQARRGAPHAASAPVVSTRSAPH